MTEKIDYVLKNVLEKIKPNESELKKFQELINEFAEKIEREIEKQKLNAEVFVGGSFAKNTVIKKENYDADVFLRFDKKYKTENISEITKKNLKNFKNVKLIHGSRDYYQIKLNENFFVELIPVMKIEKPEEHENVTDLSYLHVKYIKKKIKSKKLSDEIRIAKAFCHANKCYGAESYIQGFSGYALELLILYYKSFEKLAREMAKEKKEKIVIDIEKKFRNQKNIFMDLNKAKLHSPIILIDPTYKYRNALSALSEETFDRFKEACREFLKSPSEKAFEIKKTDLEEIKKKSEKEKKEFVLIEAKTDKQEGDIAGSKLLKFYRHLTNETEKFFEISEKGFDYNGKKSARYFFVVKKKDFVLINGPLVEDKENLKAFEKIHKNYFIKNKRVYAKEKVDFSLKKFVEKWRKKYREKIEDMTISEMDLIK